MNRASRAAVYVIAAWSGYFVMSLELLGGRALSPYFGAGIYVWGAIITIFMLGLSLGYLGGGYLSTRQPSVRQLSALLLLCAVAALPAALACEPLLEAIFAAVADPRAGALLASLLLFFVPAVIAGAISPYAVRLLIDGLHTSGRSAGKVFFVSTLGSAAGTLMTSFYWVLIFELDHLLMGMTAMSLLMGLIGFATERTEHGKHKQ